ncbi:MAG: hypothetical protein K2Y01_06235 [Rhabdochlamydiaceae bacterium]|nr:hypothetical protein [Rhabdochlamydiaceae bacterium]
MNKMFTWTVLCAISVQYSSFGLRADSSTDIQEKLKSNSSKRPSSEDLQKEVEMISLQHFFLTPHTNTLVSKPLTTENAMTKQEQPSSESLTEVAALPIEQNTPAEQEMATEVILSIQETDAKVPADIAVLPVEQKTVETILVDEKTGSEALCEVATLPIQQNTPAEQEMPTEVILSIQESDAEVPADIAVLPVEQKTVETILVDEKTASEATIELTALPVEQNTSEEITLSSQEQVPSNQETISQALMEIASSPNGQNDSAQQEHSTAQSSFVFNELIKDSQPEALPSILENKAEETYIELISTEDIKNNQELACTSPANKIEPKTQTTLVSKVVIGTVSTAVVLISIILGSR